MFNVRVFLPSLSQFYVSFLRSILSFTITVVVFNVLKLFVKDRRELFLKNNLISSRLFSRATTYNGLLPVFFYTGALYSSQRPEALLS